jgi:hypothetical protein
VTWMAFANDDDIADALPKCFQLGTGPWDDGPFLATTDIVHRQLNAGENASSDEAPTL